jgi:hypothetical protein
MVLLLRLAKLSPLLNLPLEKVSKTWLGQLLLGLIALYLIKSLLLVKLLLSALLLL